MKTILSALVAAVMAVGLSASPALSVETAMCRVCQVKHGEAEAEPAKAWRTYEGTRYGFCSEECAKEFDADPLAYVQPAFPRPAPEIGISDLKGNALRWNDFAGRVVLVDFWATWCAPCRKSMPDLQRLHEKYGARGFSVVGISIDEPKLVKKVKKFVADKRIAYPIAIDSEASPAWDRFRVKAVPAAFLVDGGGQIVAQWTGASVDVEELEGKLQTMLSP